MECCGGEVNEFCHPVDCDSLVEEQGGIRWNNLHFKGTQIRPSGDQDCHVCAGLVNGVPSQPWCVCIRPTS
jgi:hypothetical protein